MKDYYKILNLNPDATATSIKQSFRRLAMKYHPDRNAGDALSAAVFGEIAEAYAVLSNIPARKKYNNQRYHIAISEYKKPVETIDDLLNKATELKNKIAHSDPFRINQNAILYLVKQLLPDNLTALLQTDINKQKQFFDIIVWCSRLLTSKQTKNLMQIMMPLLKQHNRMFSQLEEIVKQQTKKERWDKYKSAIALLIALVLCLLIFFITMHMK